MTRVLEVGQYVAGRRIVRLFETKQRGWRATDEYGRSYYQRGPDSHPDGLLTATDTGLTRSFWPPLETGRRKPLPSVSDRKAKELADTRPVRAAVRERDGGCLLRPHSHEWGGCFGNLEVHHLHKASATGTYSLTNCLTLCTTHNQMVEHHPARAKEWGLVVNHAIPAVEAQRRRELRGIRTAGVGQ